MGEKILETWQAVVDLREWVAAAWPHLVPRLDADLRRLYAKRHAASAEQVLADWANGIPAPILIAQALDAVRGVYVSRDQQPEQLEHSLDFAAYEIGRAAARVDGTPDCEWLEETMADAAVATWRRWLKPRIDADQPAVEIVREAVGINDEDATNGQRSVFRHAQKTAPPRAEPPGETFSGHHDAEGRRIMVPTGQLVRGPRR